MEFYERYILKKLIDKSELEEAIKCTQEGLDAHLAEMNFDYDVKKYFEQIWFEKRIFSGI